MLTSLRLRIRRQHDRAKAYRDYRFLMQQSDVMLRDLGVGRSELYRAVVQGRATD